MKILLSAYSCDPTKGSELAVGWKWAAILAKSGHEVWVITHPESRENTIRHLADNPIPNLHFAYHEVEWLPHVIGRTYAGYYFQCFVWQWGAYKLAKRLHRQTRFSLVHHVTFVSVRFPSFMGLLGIPFIFGPIAGGERPPWPLILGFPLKRRLFELVRVVSNVWAKFDPVLRWITLSRARTIIASSIETARMLPNKFRRKTEVQIGIGFDPDSDSILRASEARQGPLHVMFAGRLLYWKGIHLALKAFATHREEFKSSKFTIIGAGPDSKWLHEVAELHGLSNSVEWVPWMNRTQLLANYEKFDLLLFPSTRDSGGLVVLESMSYGLPVICLDLGGPGAIVNHECGRCISTAGRTEGQIIAEIAAALRELANRDTLEPMRAAAKQRAREFTWDELVKRVYDRITANGPAESPV